MRAQRRAASDATVISVPARRRAVIEGPRGGWGRGGGSVVRLESLGGRLAVVAVEARDQGWPVIERPVLICPGWGGGQRCPSSCAKDPHASAFQARSFDGVEPATVVTVDHGPLGDDGWRCAARFRPAGVDVDQLRYHDLPLGDASSARPGGADDRMLGDLARSLRLTPEGQPGRFSRPGPDRSGPR